MHYFKTFTVQISQIWLGRVMGRVGLCMFVVMAECVLQHCPSPIADCFGKIFGIINNNSNCNCRRTIPQYAMSYHNKQ